MAQKTRSVESVVYKCWKMRGVTSYELCLPMTKLKAMCYINRDKACYLVWFNCRWMVCGDINHEREMSKPSLIAQLGGRVACLRKAFSNSGRTTLNLMMYVGSIAG